MPSDEPLIDVRDLKVTVAVIDGRWKTTILACLAHRAYRFGELRRAVGGVSEKVLISSLRELEADGLVARQVFDRVPPHVEYSMTTYGRTLCDVVAQMARWGKKHRRRTATK